MQSKGVKIGIVGLGSIGQRHVSALQSIGVTDITALRTNKGAKDVSDSNVRSVYSIEEFLKSNIDGFIISNPTSLHAETILMLQHEKKTIFVEKPLVSNGTELNSLNSVDKDLIKVGYCLRYDATIQEVKRILDSNEIGTPFLAKLYSGQYLPSWHPYTDYRNEYFSKHSLGGGAIRTLSHEIDLSNYFFGIPSSSEAFALKVSDLEIDTDDFSVILCHYANSVATIEVDFLSLDPIRGGHIFSTDGELKYDVMKNSIEIKYRDSARSPQSMVIDKSDMYIEQMKDFMRCIYGEENQLCSFTDAACVVDIIEKSNKNNEF